MRIQGPIHVQLQTSPVVNDVKWQCFVAVTMWLRWPFSVQESPSSPSPFTWCTVCPFCDTLLSLISCSWCQWYNPSQHLSQKGCSKHWYPWHLIGPTTPGWPWLVHSTFQRVRTKNLVIAYAVLVSLLLSISSTTTLCSATLMTTKSCYRTVTLPSYIVTLCLETLCHK